MCLTFTERVEIIGSLLPNPNSIREDNNLMAARLMVIATKEAKRPNQNVNLVRILISLSDSLGRNEAVEYTSTLACVPDNLLCLIDSLLKETSTDHVQLLTELLLNN